MKKDNFTKAIEKALKNPTKDNLFAVLQEGKKNIVNRKIKFNNTRN